MPHFRNVREAILRVDALTHRDSKAAHVASGLEAFQVGDIVADKCRLAPPERSLHHECTNRIAFARLQGQQLDDAGSLQQAVSRADVRQDLFGNRAHRGALLRRSAEMYGKRVTLVFDTKARIAGQSGEQALACDPECDGQELRAMLISGGVAPLEAMQPGGWKAMRRKTHIEVRDPPAADQSQRSTETHRAGGHHIAERAVRAHGRRVVPEFDQRTIQIKEQCLPRLK